jgi:hypothetical protein
MKRLVTTVLAIIFIFSCINFVFATGIQNENGQPFGNTQLGEWDKDGFVYSEKPFKNMYAEDKGLIPYSMQGKYNNPSNWAKSEVLEASKMGLNNMDIITGYQTNITRREFCNMIMQAYDKYSDQAIRSLPSKVEYDIFTDIDGNGKDKNIIRAYYLDVTYGVGNRKFNPNAYIPREQQAVMIYRFVECFDQGITSEYNVLNYFTDYDKTSGWALKEVATLGNREIIKGFPTDTSVDIGKDAESNEEFRPKSLTTKEQALLLLLRTARTFIDDQVSQQLIAPTVAYSGNGSKVTWNAIENATNYNVYVYEYLSATEKKKVKSNFTNTTSIDLKSLKSGTYEVTVMSLNEFNNSVESEPVIIYVPESTENATLSGNDLSFDVSSYKLTDWTNSSDDIKYKVEVVRGGEIINTFDNITTNSLSFPNGTIQEGDKINVYAKWNGFSSAATTITVEAVEEAEGI